jgi:hypothetical protein
MANSKLIKKKVEIIGWASNIRDEWERMPDAEKERIGVLFPNLKRAFIGLKDTVDSLEKLY